MVSTHLGFASARPFPWCVSLLVILNIKFYPHCLIIPDLWTLHLVGFMVPIMMWRAEIDGEVDPRVWIVALHTLLWHLDF